LGFETRQRRAHAEVKALAERQVAFGGGAVEAEFVWSVEVRRIAVGRAPHQQQMGIGGHFDPAGVVSCRTCR
jgi:hypothetical protein